jgi:hypothetical protein
MTAPLAPKYPLAWWLELARGWAALHEMDPKATFGSYCKRNGLTNDTYARSKLKSLGWHVNRRRCPTGR